jgi:hypothetical protein
MKAACGIEYPEAAKDVVDCELQGVPNPFASPRLLWRMKVDNAVERAARSHPLVDGHTNRVIGTYRVGHLKMAD